MAKVRRFFLGILMILFMAAPTFTSNAALEAEPTNVEISDKLIDREDNIDLGYSKRNVGNYDQNNAILIGADDYGTLLTGIADSNDNWYYIKNETMSKITVQLRQPSTGDYDLYLYKLNGTRLNLVAYSEYANRTTEQLSYLASSGYYYIKISPYMAADSGENYQFAVLNTIDYDEKEPDDNYFYANEYDETIYTNQTIDNVIDQDWSKISLSSTIGSYSLSLNTIPQGAEYVVFLYDSNLNLIESLTSTGYASQNINLTNGDYFTRVQSLNGVFSSETYNLDLKPVEENDEDEFVKVACGYASTFAIKNNGELWAWGSDVQGVLGDGTTVNTYIPIKVMDDVKDVYSNSTTIILKTNGDVYTVGAGSGGQLGNGTQTSTHIPQKILTNVKFIAGFRWAGLAIKENGELWAWGTNQYGELGDKNPLYVLRPIKIMDHVKYAEKGGNGQIYIVKENGELWSAGFNSTGQLGNGTTTNSRVYIKIMDDVASVKSNNSNAFVIKENGELWVWGRNLYGVLGINSTTAQYNPIKIMDDVKEVASGYDHTLITKNNGELWACGRNYYGQLGIGTTDNSSVPVKVMDNVKTAAASNHSFAITEHGEIWGWGFGSTGRLGNGETTNALTPIPISVPANIIIE